MVASPLRKLAPRLTYEASERALLVSRLKNFFVQKRGLTYEASERALLEKLAVLVGGGGNGSHLRSQ